MKVKTFPDNPFLPAFSRIAIIDGLLMLVAASLAYVFSQVWMYIMAAAVLLSIGVFVLLNQRVIRTLQCPHCHQPITFRKGDGLCCEKCKTIWELG